MSGGRLYALFGEDTHGPITATVIEEAPKDHLQTCVGLLAPVSLQEDAFEIVAVRAIDGCEVLGDGNESRGRHGAIMHLETWAGRW